MSAPHLAMYSSGMTTFPFDFDILAPSLTMRPCARKVVNGSSNSTWPSSCSTMEMNREYSRCSTACSLPPMYIVTGHQRRVRAGSKGRSSKSVLA